LSSLVFDTEADGLLYEATQIWCIVTKELATPENNYQSEVKQYHGESIADGVDALLTADTIIGHNIINYDIPLLRKLGYVSLDHRLNTVDTFTLSSLLNPDRVGGHGLDAWGKRFKRYKPEHEDWSQFSDAMLHRCTEDVEINHLVYLELLKEEKR